jgi:hypothetical protein
VRIPRIKDLSVAQSGGAPRLPRYILWPVESLFHKQVAPYYLSATSGKVWLATFSFLLHSSYRKTIAAGGRTACKPGSGRPGGGECDNMGPTNRALLMSAMPEPGVTNQSGPVWGTKA